LALQKPILGTIAAFDASGAQEIPFIVSSGDQVVQNRAVIRLGSTNEVVYDQTETTFELKHTIPANTLTNGNYYVITIYTLNAYGSISAPSAPVTFYCYTTPLFYFDDLPVNHVIMNSSYDFTLAYNQDEGETLDAYIVNVYDSSQTLIWTSNTVYTGSNGVPPTSFNIPVSGFSDGSLYYIRAMGQTTQQTELDTGYILLTAIFSADNIYTRFSLLNNDCEGYIVITSNIVSLDGVSNPDPPVYINHEEVDLTGDDSYVTWENSFALYDKSTVRIWARDINPNSIVATFYNSGNPEEASVISEREYTESGTTYIYVELSYSSLNGTTGYVYSEPIVKPSSSDMVMIWVQKNYGMYDISIEEVGS
jgi:hypothetical protein